MKTNTSTKPARFAKIIGQEYHKMFLNHMIDANAKSKIPLPCLNLCGEKGSGKTTVAREIISAMQAEFPDAVAVLPVVVGKENLDNLPTPNDLRGESGDQVAYRQFSDNLNVVLGNDHRAIIVLDEVHELGKGPNYSPQTYKHLASFLMNACILSMEGRQGRVKVGETSCLWNPEKHMIIMATNYPEKMNPALWSRGREIRLGAYTQDDLRHIFMYKLSTLNLRASEDSISPIISLCRTSARDIDVMLGEIQNVIGAQAKKTINKEDVKVAMRQLQKYPHGFCKDFVRALELIKGVTYSTLTLETLFPSMKGQIAKELSIAFHAGLVAKKTGGYQLSDYGSKALANWEKEGFAWK